MDSKRFFEKTIFFLILLNILTSCRASQPGKSVGERTAESFVALATGGRVNLDSQDGSVAVLDKESGITTTLGKELPGGFPKDFPIYAGALVQSSYVDENGSLSVELYSADSLEQLSSYYQRYLKKKGWQNTPIARGENELGWTVANTLWSGSLFINIADEGTLITISLD